jgi:hypothetical protein
MSADRNKLRQILELLERHYQSFYSVVDVATATGHPVPVDTRGWSQILVSVLTGTKGLVRKKGADLDDGSDVKGANTWEAIDTPRFNGVIKAGTKAAHSDKIESLDTMPHLFFVLWDKKSTGAHRCRIWCVRPQKDTLFRNMCEAWYDARLAGKIRSNNFQLHPPRGKDTNIFRNRCGNLIYPLLFAAERDENSGNWHVTANSPDFLQSGICEKADPASVAELLS